MKPGSFGKVVFEVSEKAIRTFTDLNRSTRAVFATHEVINGPPRLQHTGRELSEVGFKIRFHHRFCDPVQEIKDLRTILETGDSRPLVIGSDVWGHFVLEDLAESYLEVAGNGVVMIADVDLRLKEDAHAGK